MSRTVYYRVQRQFKYESDEITNIGVESASDLDGVDISIDSINGDLAMTDVKEYIDGKEYKREVPDGTLDRQIVVLSVGLEVERAAEMFEFIAHHLREVGKVE